MCFFTEVGRGTFGIILMDGTQRQADKDIAAILKRTISTDCDFGHRLCLEARWHRVISGSLSSSDVQQSLTGIHLPCVPRFFNLITPDDVWWTTRAYRRQWIIVSKGIGREINQDRYRERTPLVSAQRISNVKVAIARGLLQDFGPSHYQNLGTGHELPEHLSALLRIYFGQSTPANTNSNLHNFPLYHDRLDTLLSEGDRVKALKVIAAALAFLHWHVRCDAKDVEFVFGGLDPFGDGDHHPTFKLYGEKCHMWLLDFDQVEAISMDIEGVEKAVLGYENDPYYPKPSDNLVDWWVFKNEYLSVSQKLLAASEGAAAKAVNELPKLFIHKVEGFQGLNRGQRALEFATPSDTDSSVVSPSVWSSLRQIFW